MKASFAAIAIAALSLASAAPLRTRSTTYSYCDTDGSLSYSGEGWQHLTNQGNIDKCGSESYTNVVGDSVAKQIFIPGTYDIEVIGALKCDRGTFEVYVDDTYIGYGNEYDENAQTQTGPQTVFSAQGVQINIGQTLYIKNGETGGAFFDFQQLVLTQSF